MDFAGLRFDTAMKQFLSGFRLPGEAQKIDRMMEKFAERFHDCNGSVFPSADTAFILAFSTIMLNTDLHNPSIKEEARMTKKGFRGNNRGIANGADIPDAVLDGIYDRLKADPISLKEDDDARARAEREERAAKGGGMGIGGLLFGGGDSAALLKKSASEFHKVRHPPSRSFFTPCWCFLLLLLTHGNSLPLSTSPSPFDNLQERASMAKAGDAMLKQASRRRQAALAQQNAAKKMDAEAAILALGADEGGSAGGGGAAGVGGAAVGGNGNNGMNHLGQGQTTFHHLQDLQQEHVAPMFEMAWAPMLAVFSLNLETTDGVLCVGGSSRPEKGSSDRDRNKSAAAREAEEEEENAARVISLCLAGIRNAIRVAARFQMAVVRDAFVTSLAKFTTLDTVREMTSKNVECIKTLIAIALQVRSYLAD